MFASALDFQGLYTFPSPLSKAPAGSALVAENLVATKDGIAESRRGLAMQGISLALTSGQFIDQWFAYQNRLIIHDTSNNLWYDLTGNFNWVKYSSSFTNPVGAIKMRGVEANKNLYLTTSAGIQKTPLYTTTPSNAGVPPANYGTAALAGAGSGFLANNMQCAYQIVFGYTDVNGNLLLGNPSQRISIINSGGGADNVTLTFLVPSGLTTNYFYQVYRTPQTTYSATPASNVPPGVELQLSSQQTLTAGQIAAGSVTFTDVTTDALLGVTLYTCPSQQGALQTNDRPPLALDMCLFSQMMFYANVETLSQLTMTLISVGAPNGIQVGDSISAILGPDPLIDPTIFITGAVSNNFDAFQFAVVTGGTVSENIAATAGNIVGALNAAGLGSISATYLSGYNGLPGLIGVQCNSYSDRAQIQFSITSSRPAAFNPTLDSLVNGISSSDTLPNAIYVSKVGQPEAAPAVNVAFVGGGDQPIYRVLPLRDRVIVLKSDGVFVITGSTPQTLTVTLLDSTIICIAPESARLFNNSVYCMTNQGVVSITESGVTIQSRAIEGDLLALSTASFTNFTSCCQAISYESERLYILSMPTQTTDTYGTQAWCYNWVTNAWTHWPIDCASGIVNPFDNKLYMGRPTTNHNYAYQERKNYAYSDYIDDQTAITISGVDSTGLVLSLSSSPLTSWVGYGVEQTVNDVTYIAIIDSVDTVNNTVTVNLTNSTTPGSLIPWVRGSAFLDVPIPLTLVYTPITAGFPHYVKSWSRINFWFNSGNFTQIYMGFMTDMTGPQYAPRLIANQPATAYGGGFYGDGPYGGASNFSQAIQTLVTPEASSGRWIEPVLSLSFPYARLSCMGPTISYELIGDSAG